jgi:hypothetical protein
LRLGNQLQLELDVQQNAFRNLTLASKINLGKYVEIMEQNTENQKALSHSPREDKTHHYSGDDLINSMRS